MFQIIAETIRLVAHASEPVAARRFAVQARGAAPDLPLLIWPRQG